MKCPYCGNEAIYCENKEIYGKNYGKSYMCYLCKPCNAYVGTHQNSTKPLGTMANEELREWRMKTHQAVDVLWKEKGMTRKDMYNKLNQHFERQTHIGECDIEMCKKIIDFIKNK